MRVLVLGGCGAQGTFATRELVASDEFSEVIIGDYNVQRARMLASELSDYGAVVEKVDVRDRGETVKLMRRCDVVVNCIGPFYRFGEVVLRSAIEAGRDYVDICDDADATVRMLSLSNEAARKGITAVIGLGASPGITNIISKALADEFDELDEIRQYWVVDSSTDPEGVGVMFHAAHGLSGRVPQYMNGKVVEVKAGSGAEIVEFLSGAARVVYFGHPEPVTLPQYIEVKTVINKGGFLPDRDFRIFLAMSKLGMFSEKGIGNMTPRRIFIPLLSKISTQHKLKEGTRTAMRIEFRGVVNGEVATYVAHLHGHMGPATGMPAAVGAIMIAKGDIDAKGVLPPEACINTEIFLKMASERVPENSELFLEITRGGKTERLPLLEAI